MPGKVLLATRLREEPDAVGRAAARLATRLDAELVLLYVADEVATVPEIHAATGLDSDQLRERMLEDLHAIAEDYALRNLTGARTRAIVVDGDPVDRIVEIAKAEQVDYLVIGTEGRAALHELIVGNTAARILRRAPCPVVVVPPA